jgi:hypothetical protein
MERSRNDRLTRAIHDDGRIEPVARDVADREENAIVRQRECIVPIAADLRFRRCGHVGRVQAHARRERQRLLQERFLEGVGDTLFVFV